MKKPKPKKKTIAFVLQFVEQEMPVLPLVEKSKRPSVKHGLHDATTDKAVLKQYFRDHPDANFGVRTGGLSDIFVLDIDGPAGKRSLSKLIEKNGPLPKSVTVETANGEHRYFRGGDLPLNFHPVAIRASAGDAPSSAVSVSA